MVAKLSVQNFRLKPLTPQMGKLSLPKTRVHIEVNYQYHRRDHSVCPSGSLGPSVEHGSLPLTLTRVTLRDSKSNVTMGGSGRMHLERESTVV